jgi:hypothetical protein
MAASGPQPLPSCRPARVVNTDQVPGFAQLRGDKGAFAGSLRQVILGKFFSLKGSVFLDSGVSPAYCVSELGKTFGA